jgi:hypothetical protein
MLTICLCTARRKSTPGRAFFHVSALRDGDQITQGKAVKFEIGVDPKSGKTKAVSVEFDLKAPLSVEHANATREAWPLLPRER